MWKKFTIERTLRYISLCVFFSLGILESLPAQDSVGVAKKDKWYAPDFTILQYAGSIGFLSAGAGYAIFHDKANVDLLFGYVPASIGGAAIETVTLKFNASPWKIRLNRYVALYPLTSGAYFCYNFGREYSSDLPSWYPDGYYWWSEAVRANIFIGGNGRMATERLKYFNKIDFYYELGTNEIKLVSYAQNSGTLSLWKILHLGIGIRFHFRK